MRPVRVLVVDDDFMVADIHQRLVEREPGFEVVGIARNAESAVEAIASLQPDLVLLDLYLPDQSGLDVIARARAQQLTADFLVLTAAKDVETVRQALRLGIVHYLIKPFSAAVLVERLRAYRKFLSATSESLSGGLEKEVDQRAIDRALSLTRVAGAETLPKGLSAVTLTLISETLRKFEATSTDIAGSNSSIGGTAADGSRAGMTATEVARDSGVSRVSARRYLEYLVEQGSVEMRPRYGTTGRPEHGYRWIAN